MTINQVSVFVENKVGVLADVCNILHDKNVDIRVLSIADTTDFGILRLIVNDPETACKELKASGYTASMTSVLAVEMLDRPGGLAEVLELIEKNGILIEYMYAFVAVSHKSAYAIIRVDRIDPTLELLKRNGVKALTSEELYNY